MHKTLNGRGGCCWRAGRIAGGSGGRPAGAVRQAPGPGAVREANGETGRCRRPRRPWWALNAATRVAVVLLAVFVGLVKCVNGVYVIIASIWEVMWESGVASSAEVQAAADVSDKTAQEVADLSVRVAALRPTWHSCGRRDGAGGRRRCVGARTGRLARSGQRARKGGRHARDPAGDGAQGPAGPGDRARLRPADLHLPGTLLSEGSGPALMAPGETARGGHGASAATRIAAGQGSGEDRRGSASSAKLGLVLAATPLQRAEPSASASRSPPSDRPPGAPGHRERRRRPRSRGRSRGGARGTCGRRSGRPGGDRCPAPPR